MFIGIIYIYIYTDFFICSFGGNDAKLLFLFP